MQVSPIGWRYIVVEQHWQSNWFGHLLSTIREWRRGNDDAYGKSRFRRETKGIALEHQTKQIGPRSSLQRIEDGIARIANREVNSSGQIPLSLTMVLRLI